MLQQLHVLSDELTAIRRDRDDKEIQLKDQEMERELMQNAVSFKITLCSFFHLIYLLLFPQEKPQRFIEITSSVHHSLFVVVVFQSTVFWRTLSFTNTYLFHSLQDMKMTLRLKDKRKLRRCQIVIKLHVKGIKSFNAMNTSSRNTLV